MRDTLEMFIDDEATFLEAYDILEPALYYQDDVPYFTNTLMKKFYDKYPPAKHNQKPLQKMAGIMDKETKNYYRSQFIDNPIVANLWPENAQQYPTIAHWFEHLSRIYSANGYEGLKKSILEQNLLKPLKMAEGRNTSQFSYLLATVVKKTIDLQKFHDDFGVRPDLALAFGEQRIQAILLKKMPDDLFDAYLKRLSQDKRLIETTIEYMATPHINVRGKSCSGVGAGMLAANFKSFLEDIQKNKLPLERFNQWLVAMGETLNEKIIAIGTKYNKQDPSQYSVIKDPLVLLGKMEEITNATASHRSLDDKALKQWQEYVLRTIAGQQPKRVALKV